MTAPTATSAAGFAILLLWALVIEVAGYRGAGASAADAIAAAMRRPPGRAAVLAAWLWLGVHFLAR